MANVHLSAAEHEGRVVFLHSVKDGPASQSYGLAVAQLAGIPQAVISAARHKLQQLEQQSVSVAGGAPVLAAVAPAIEPASPGTAEDAPRGRMRAARAPEPGPQPDLFATRYPSEIELQLRDVDPDNLTPRQAHELLYALKKLL